MQREIIKRQSSISARATRETPRRGFRNTTRDFTVRRKIYFSLDARRGEASRAQQASNVKALLG